jgi:hypothetical protein
MTKRKRDRAALLIAAIASVVALLLAIAPILTSSAISYDPQLAVVTATLVAVIWYTYFTFLAVHREEAGRVVYELKFTPSDMSIDLELENPTRRTVVARANTRVQLDGTEVPNLPAEFSGSPIRLTPLRSPTFHVDLPKLITIREAPAQPLRFSRIRAEITIDWKDDLGGSGRLVVVSPGPVPAKSR